MKRDIASSQDIVWMVERFYGKIKTDPLVGFIFTDVMKVHWDRHIPLLVAFWENALFYTGGYKGNALKKHININKVVPLQKKHFVRWLQLFNETVEEKFEGEKATLAKQRAANIAHIIQIKLKLATVK
ncbi:MAG: group III truncated hemoglobin [Chitinophagaceae bacterium]|nr:MAG: group III truncated hemoglobin [Chitinophagaceae bacterium]